MASNGSYLDWPPEAEAAYARICSLGKGAYGTVWMAKAKESAPEQSLEYEDTDEYVAIKFIKAKTVQERAYAAREIDILAELRHPNIIRLARAFDDRNGAGYRLCVMSLARGPDIGQLLGRGGALGLPVARLVSRHLVAAVGYLHGRGVMHRDIKPSNLCLLRADASPERVDVSDVLEDDLIWSNGKDAAAAAEGGRYKLMLVDFGFARALSPSDLGGERGADTDEVDDGDGGRPGLKHSFARGGGRQASRRSLRFRGSIALRPIRGISALGTRAFAAPEVKEDVVRNAAGREEEVGGGSGAAAAVALAECVSNYGMIADAFSVGVTLKEVLTGVPAHETDVAAYISARDNVVGNILSALTSCRGGGGKRRKCYRYIDEVPKLAAALVKELTKAKAAERLTVREAQTHPWITGEDQGEGGYEIPRGDVPSRHGDPIVFLKCAGGGGVERREDSKLDVVSDKQSE